MADQVAGKAKRGDLIVVHVHLRYLRGYDSFHVGVVTSVTRDGQVKAVREVGSETSTALDQFGDVRATYRVSQAKVDVDAALATFAAHTWALTQDRPLAKPYDTLGKVEEALRPHLRKAA